MYVIKFNVYNKSIMCNKSTLSIIKVQCIKKSTMYIIKEQFL